MFFNKSNKEIQEFAQKNGFKGAKYVGKWKKYTVYEPYMSDNEISYTGLPLVILVNENNEIRWSTQDEATTPLDVNSFTRSYEKNKTSQELNFSNRQEAIDAYINKFGGFPFMSLKGLPDEIIIEKIKNALKYDEEISVEFNDKNELPVNITDRKLEQEQIETVLKETNDTKMVNNQIETYFKSLMEVQTDVKDEYLSLPIIDMIDKSNIKLQSIIISSYNQDNKKYYYCQGYINKDYNIKTLPTCKLFDNVELINSEFSMLSVIPKGEYSNLTIDELKDKYYGLLDILKKLVVKEPNDITSDEATIILDYLKLYRYLEKDEVQAYQSLKNDFLIWCMGMCKYK